MLLFPTDVEWCGGNKISLFFLKEKKNAQKIQKNLKNMNTKNTDYFLAEGPKIIYIVGSQVALVAVSSPQSNTFV